MNRGFGLRSDRAGYYRPNIKEQAMPVAGVATRPSRV
jgi:hypothetical protein